MRNHLTCRFRYKDKLEFIPGELDFKIMQKGKVGFFDCKSFNDERFSYSMLDKAQIERAELYNDYGTVAGFIVWFRKVNQVVYFTGQQIAKIGPKTSFGVEDGQSVGQYELIDLRPIMEL